MRFIAVLVLSGLVAAVAPPSRSEETEKAKPSEFGALKFRPIGPAIGGRITRVAGVARDPLVFYAAAAQGGVWKSENGGHAWKPVFDEQMTQSVGSLAVAPSDPNVIYVGSGEANIRGNVAIGWGIFKSTDAGKTWKHVWKARGQIGTMIVHPSDPDIAYAAVLGSPFGPSPERGVYRTRDGGASWQRVLYRDADTGASDVAFDPANPRIVFAGLWQTRRTPWSLTSGGPGSGLHRSEDGGDTWKQLAGAGLPEGEWGKVGVAVAPSDPNRVYALIEAAEGGLFRSDDAGAKWERINANRTLRQRAWYYSTLVVDPKNADVLWFPQVPLLKSIDGGKTVAQVEGPHHGDHHDLWIDPSDPRRMIDGNDGGIDMTVDGGKTWWSPDLPLAQFYNIDVDDRVPYHVGGTIQDMGTASGPSRALRESGTVLGDWDYVGGGEAGDFVYDRGAPGHVYAGEYGGYITHYQEGTGQFRNVTIYPANPSGHGAEDMRYRFQWTAPIADSPHDPKAIYHGGNVLFRSTDRGATWSAISGDLTRNDRSKQQWSGGPITGDNTGVEFYGTIFSVAESPVQAGTIWTGSDDGLVHVTRDGGKTWANVTGKAWPEWGTVEAIEPSRRDAGTAYVVVDAHRLDDFRPYVFRTRDYGRSWEKLVDGLPVDMHVLVVREDPADANHLYLGGERGAWYSRDAGAHWRALPLKLPAVAVVDMEVAHGDLVLGTRGRSLWVLEDVSALRQLAALQGGGVRLLQPRPAQRFRLDGPWGDEGVIENPPYGAAISYWLPAAAKEDISLQVLDTEGRLLRTLSSKPRPPRYPKDDPDEPGKEPEPELTKEQGLNRIAWDLRESGSVRLDRAKIDYGDPEQGPLVLPGRYTLKLVTASGTDTTELEVQPDPRTPVPAAELAANHAFLRALRDMANRNAAAVETVRAVKEQAEDLKARTARGPHAAELAPLCDAVVARADAIEGALHNPRAEVVYDILAFKGGAQLYSQLAPLYAWSMQSDHAPTQGMRERQRELEQELARHEAAVASLKATEVRALEAKLAALDLPRIIVE